MDIYSAQRLIGEDAVNTMHERYNILKFLSETDHAGRRMISDNLFLSERTVRNHLEYLEMKDLITVGKSGAAIKKEGLTALSVLTDYFSRMFSSKEKETALKELLGIDDVVIVRGDSSFDQLSVHNIAYEADKILTGSPLGAKVIAVSGGNTMKAVSDNLKGMISDQCTVIPVRGAVGRSHAASANSISSTMGMRLKCNAYRLNIPDGISLADLDVLAESPDITAVTDLYDKIDILFFGISDPKILIENRTFGELEKGLVSSPLCVGEALGFYLDSEGRVIKSPEKVGLSKDQINRIPKKYAVAGGSGKSKAIKALCAFINDIVLITDEGCADALLNK
ncbi:MAG: hypothetical protein IKM61_05745 [Eubacteriaceae bacterium]|nr:hypothetical protein [Eubacteriaceae bacterium]